MLGRINSFLMAAGDGLGMYDIVKGISIAILVIMVLCAGFTICVVLFQSSSSTGIGALGGTTETFLGKNKKSTTESKLKRLTVVCLVLLIVLSVISFLLWWWLSTLA